MTISYRFYTKGIYGERVDINGKITLSYEMFLITIHVYINEAKTWTKNIYLSTHNLTCVCSPCRKAMLQAGIINE